MVSSNIYADTMSTTTDTQAETAQILQVSDQMEPLMKELPSNVHGGVLACLMARWIAGHEMVDDSAATLRVQDTLMRAHFRLIMQLLLGIQAEKGWKE